MNFAAYLPTPNLSRFNYATLLVAGGFVLALKPAEWLVGTWYEDGYEGMGWVAFALLAALVLWSRSSALLGSSESHRSTYLLLALTALIRLVAQILDINVLAALLLAVDVFALARIAELDQRVRAVSPFWLAILFCFSLPVEPIMQRLIGYDLQLISAWLACNWLTPLYDNLTCEGVRLQIKQVDVLVDLPCSGAELLSISALIFACINAVRLPSWRTALWASIAALAIALLGNSFRIVLLAIGIVHEGALPINVMDPTPHSIVGLVVVALVSGGLWWVSSCYPTSNQDRRKSQAAMIESTPGSYLNTSSAKWFAISFFLFALLVGAIQPRPVDAFPRSLPPSIPLVAAGFLSDTHALTAQEQRYFTRYGGSATRASFGPFGLLLVNTQSPLRHLHDPTICLRGAGFEVDFLGTDHGTHSAIYKASRQANDHESVEPTAQYLVRVSYQSNHGQLASSVSQAIWYWLRDPSSSWTMVQRITPLNPSIDPGLAHEWEQAMRRAYNLT